MICLANSRKLNGRCIAGIELSCERPVGWIRPVSAREHEEVSEYERQYNDGRDPSVLDIIDVPLLDARPKGYQQENWLLDREHYWKKVGRATWNDLERIMDLVDSLWINGYSTQNGFNDKIPLALAESLNSSLRLIRMDCLKLLVFMTGEGFNNSRRRVQGRFEHDGIQYRFWVTDPVYERGYLAKQDGEYEIGESFLTISLGEPYNDFCYKLIAAIIERGGGIRE